MSDHSLIGDNASDASVPDVVEAKVWASTLASAGAGAAAAVLNAVQENPSMLAGLPVWAQSVVLVLVPPVLVFLAGYFKPSNRV